MFYYLNAHVESLFRVQILQASLMPRQSSKSDSMKLSCFEQAHSSCASKLKSAQDLVAFHSKAEKEVQAEFDEFVKKVLSSEVKMNEEAQKAVNQNAMRTQVEVMLENFLGEHASWDMNETIRMCNEAYPEDAFPMFIPPAHDGEAFAVDEMGLQGEKDDEALDDGVGENKED